MYICILEFKKIQQVTWCQSWFRKRQGHWASTGKNRDTVKVQHSIKIARKKCSNIWAVREWKETASFIPSLEMSATLVFCQFLLYCNCLSASGPSQTAFRKLFYAPPFFISPWLHLNISILLIFMNLVQPFLCPLCVSYSEWVESPMNHSTYQNCFI